MSRHSIRALFDVTPVISGSTGIARYVTQVTNALERLPVEIQRFAVGRSAFPPPPDTRHLRVPSRLAARWWQTAPWPALERVAGDADVVHLSGALMARTRRPLIVTVHDIAAVRHPELHPARHVRQQQVQLDALSRATVVVTVSRTTADDLAALGVEPERLIVVPLGVTPLPAPAEPAADERLDAGYLLAVGETSPRKGYSILLEALASLDRGPGLVMAGPPASDEARLRSLAGRLGVAPRVTRLDAVSDARLAGLYRGALALCFPSVTEGFGLPVLEAMASGVPVIASDIPATREVAGSAALYVGGGGEQAWAEAIDAIASDTRLRSELGEAGRARAAEFTWARTASATLDAYRLALAATR